MYIHTYICINTGEIVTDRKRERKGERKESAIVVPHSDGGAVVLYEDGNSAKGPVFFRPRYIAAGDGIRCEGDEARGRVVAHMPEKRERHDKLDLMTVAKKRDMKVGRAGRTDRN